jgi:hypothetical protein
MIPAKRGLLIYRCVATMSCSNGVWGCASASMMAMGLPPFIQRDSVALDRYVTDDTAHVSPTMA